MPDDWPLLLGPPAAVLMFLYWCPSTLSCRFSAESLGDDG